MRIVKPMMFVASVSVGLFAAMPLASADTFMQPPQGGGIEKQHRDWSGRDRRGHAGRNPERRDRAERRDWGQRSAARSNKGWHGKANVIEGKKRRFYSEVPDFSGDGALPDYIRGLGTFSGAISAVRDRKNGIYFYRDRSNSGGVKILTAPSPSGPSIIGVTPESFEAACDRQGSVCVIKPR